MEFIVFKMTTPKPQNRDRVTRLLMLSRCRARKMELAFMNLTLALTGASGAIFGREMLRAQRRLDLISD
jgi:hypothetical protein